MAVASLIASRTRTILLQQQSGGQARRKSEVSVPAIRFDPATPPVRQSGTWQCSAASTTWMLRSIGIAATEAEVCERLGSGRISSADGLLNGSGAGLVELVGELGLRGDRAWLSFDEVLARAGRQPLAIGGANWNHWSAVRGRQGDLLLLANPAPGWRGIGDEMTREEFAALGPFAAVWIELPAATGATTSDLPPIDSSSPARFVASVLPYARTVETETGVPAAIMVAMAINETGYGKHALGNNFFGIKADPSWRGPTTGEVWTWEDFGAGRVDIRDTFRAYPDPADSFRDFARFLEENPRYGTALQLKADPARFIEEIWRAGYATDPLYPRKILAICETWELI